MDSVTIKIDGITNTFTSLRTEYDQDRVLVNKPRVTELRDTNGNVVHAYVYSAEISYPDHKSGKLSVSLLSFVSGCNCAIFTKPALTREGLPPMGIMDGIFPPETPEGEIAFQALVSQHVLSKKAASAAERQAKRDQEAASLADLFQQVAITETEKGSTEVEALRLAAAAKIAQKAALKASKIEASEACKAPPRVIAVAKRSRNAPVAADAAPMEVGI